MSPQNEYIYAFQELYAYEFHHKFNNMDARNRKYGLQNIFLVAILALFFMNFLLSGFVYAGNGAELFGEVEDLLSYPGINNG